MEEGRETMDKEICRDVLRQWLEESAKEIGENASRHGMVFIEYLENTIFRLDCWIQEEKSSK